MFYDAIFFDKHDDWLHKNKLTKLMGTSRIIFELFESTFLISNLKCILLDGTVRTCFILCILFDNALSTESRIFLEIYTYKKKSQFCKNKIDLEPFHLILSRQIYKRNSQYV